MDDNPIHTWPPLPHPVPPTQSHNQAECSRFFGDDLLRPVAYAGSASKRKQLAKHLGLTNTAPSPPSAEVTPKKKAEGDGAGTADFANVIITSYSVLRSDAEILGEQVRKADSVGEYLFVLVADIFFQFSLGKQRRA